MYEFKGTVKKVGELQTFSSGFSKRDLVVEEDKLGKWSNVVSFTFKKDKASLLDAVSIGAKVKVAFAVDGREWTDPRTGNVKYFTDLTGMNLEVEGGAAVPQPAVPPVDAFDQDGDDVIPF